MDIKLYYLEGVSREDTPLIGNRSNYWSTHLVKTVDSAWYPPYYKNKIQFNTDDVDLSTKINYLTFEQNGITFCYFINSIEFINEGILALHIEMDTIQTFRNYIKIGGSLIERKFIPRWVDNKINRNYIRENIAKGFMKQTYHKHYSKLGTDADDYSDYVIVAKNVEDVQDDYEVPGQAPSVYQYRFLEQVRFPILEGASYQFIPVALGKKQSGDIDTYMTFDDEDNTYVVDVPYSVFWLSRKATTRAIYVFPFNPINPDLLNCGQQNDAYCDSSKFYVYHRPGEQGEINENCGWFNALRDTQIEMNLGRIVFPLDFVKNTSNTAVFDKKYCPCLMDENYMRVEFGETTGYSVAPLYQFDIPELQLYYWANISTGLRFYSITDEIVSFDYGEILNEYGQVGVTTAPLMLDHSSDTYENWASRNVGTIMKNATVDVGAIALGLVSGALPLSVKGLGNIVNTTTEAMNAYQAPDQLVTTGRAWSEFASTHSWISVTTYEVNDIDRCAEFYHKYGYKVEEPYRAVKTLNELFDYVNTRRYYAYVKLSETTVYLEVLQSDEIINDITERLTNGLRLWNVDVSFNTIGDYKFDNKEN